MRHTRSLRWGVVAFALPAGFAVLAADNRTGSPNDPMTPEVNKQTSRRALEMWIGGATIDESVFTADYVNHQEPVAAGGVGAVTLAQWTAIVKANHQAFPDLDVAIEAQVVEGDRVATHWRFTATQTGPYEGLAPTGRRVSWTGVQIDRFEAGRIAESWVNWDKFTLFQTLGLLK